MLDIFCQQLLDSSVKNTPVCNISCINVVSSNKCTLRSSSGMLTQFPWDVPTYIVLS